MQRWMLFVCGVLVSLILPCVVQGQEVQEDSVVARPHTLGVYGAAGVAWSSVPANGVEGVPTCCPEYTDNSGFTWQAGVRYGIPVSFGGLALRAGLLQVGVTSTVEQTVGSVLVNGSVVDAVVANELSLQNLSLTVGLDVDFMLTSRLGLTAGLAVGLPLDQTYSISETLLTPGALFENGTTVRNAVSSAEVGENTVFIVPSLGLHYNVAIGDAWTLKPHLLVQWSPLSSSANLVSWTWFSGVLGIGIERSL